MQSLSPQTRSLSRRPRASRARRMNLECLEGRQLLSGVVPNDPGFTQQWDLQDTGQAGNHYDADMDMPAAWSVTTGSTATVVAVLDSGVDYTEPDLYLNVWLNPGEIPAAIQANLTDSDSDGIVTFHDLNAPVNAGFVTDLNANGYIDGGDLLRDPQWANGIDDESDGKVDDLIGWDFHDDDNDPQATVESHGTAQAKTIGANTNNGVGTAGINWAVRIMPVRIRSIGGDTSDLSNANAAAGIDYAVASGAPISNNSWRTAGGGYVFSQEVFNAIDRARQAGHLFVAAAGNDSTNNDSSPFFPASCDLDNIISATRVDAFGQLGANYGANTVDLAVYSDGGTSTSSSHTAGAAALLKSMHLDWTYAEIKGRLLSTVDPLSSLAGKTVTGGTLNAAQALATTAISISDPILTEGDSGTSQMTFSVSRVGDSTSAVTLNWSTAAGTATAGNDYVAASGQIAFLSGGANTQTITIDIVGDLAAEAPETFFVNLGLASGNAVLADEAGLGTILDTDTKFYVVDDAFTNRTFEYGSGGASIEDYALNTGNAAPRGAASTAAGDRVSVVDANKKVYVYNPSGGPLGSWTAGSLASNATIEGIATNGTDVWIVDARQDRVYKYTGAASRLSGSQNAASSFALNSANKGPKDIVTDGAYLWALNDSSTDKVFKYTLSGALVGSWTITGAGSSPTGITLDPTDVNHLWIVDSGSDRVYQFDAAAGRTSGSQSPSTSFALAAGNTNPQGIADPPTPHSSRAAIPVPDARPVPYARPVPARRATMPSRASRPVPIFVLGPDWVRASSTVRTIPSGPLGRGFTFLTGESSPARRARHRPAQAR